MNVLKAMKVGLVKSGYFLKKHAPTILTVFGVSGSIGSVVLAVKATPKAMKLIDERKKTDKKEKLTVIETVDTCWKAYTPAAISLVTAVGCIIGANCLNLKAQATLLGLYSAANERVQAIQNKTNELLKEEDARSVKRESIKEELERSNILGNFTPIRPGEYPVIDGLTRQVVSGTRDSAEKAILEMKTTVNESDLDGASVNQWLTFFGGDMIQFGDDLGYNAQHPFYAYVETIESHGMLCYYIYHEERPVKDYNYCYSKS